MSSLYCTICRTKRPKNAFSHNQLKRKSKRRCKKCANKQQNAIYQPVKDNLLQLHQYCKGKYLFSEFAVLPDEDKKSLLNHKQSKWRITFQKLGVFYWRNTMIIATNNSVCTHQSLIKQALKKWEELEISPSCVECVQPLQQCLVLRKGIISKHGIKLKNKAKKLHSTSLQEFLPQKYNDKRPIPGADRVNFRNGFRKIENARKHKKNTKAKIAEAESNYQSEFEQKIDATSMHHSFQHLKDCESALAQHHQDLKYANDKLKEFYTDEKYQKWMLIRDKMKTNGNDTFDQNTLEKIVNLLNRLPIDIQCKIDKKRGHGSHIIMHINSEIITISKRMLNKHFIDALDEKLDKCVTLEPINNNVMAEAEQKYETTVQSLSNHEDIIERMVQSHQSNINRLSKLIKNAKKQIIEGSQQLHMVWDNFYKQEYKTHSKHLKRPFHMRTDGWNILEFVCKGHGVDRIFMLHILDNRDAITGLLSDAFGNPKIWQKYKLQKAECVYFEFALRSRNILISYWIAVLQILSLPVTVKNLNLLVNKFLPYADRLFETLGRGTLNVIMVLSAAMIEFKLDKQPFQFEYVMNNDLDIVFRDESDIDETTGMDYWGFYTVCLHYAISLFPGYSKPTTHDIMMDRISRYLSKECGVEHWKRKYAEVTGSST